jgi:hypothetical protein
MNVDTVGEEHTGKCYCDAAASPLTRYHSDPSHTSDASHAMVRQVEGDQTDDQVIAKFYFQSVPATSGVEL